MSKPGQTLGGRLPLADPTTLTGAQQELVEVVKATWAPWANEAGFQVTTADGRLIGPFNALLLRPEVAAKFWEFSAAVATPHDAFAAGAGGGGYCCGRCVGCRL